MNKKEFTYIDLFSGIGGFRLGLDANGGKSKGFSEIDKWAIETYKDNFDISNEIELGDVTKLKTLPKVDLITGGVPCQSWSVAGKKRGFDDPRGRLWHDAIRLVNAVQPKVFIFENVKGLKDPRNRANLELIMDSFKKSGYTVFAELLNSYDYDVPQNRSRIYIVGFRNDFKESIAKFNYPKPNKINKNLAHYIEDIEQREVTKVKYRPSTLHGNRVPRARNAFQNLNELNDFFVFCDTRNGHTSIHSWDIYRTTKREKDICLTILKNRRKKIYGESDGNPLTYSNLTELIPDLNSGELEALVEKNILKKVEPNKYELRNSKNSSGIEGIYRIFLPNSRIFSTLTATGTKDFVATDYLNFVNPDNYKEEFIRQIFKTGKFRAIKPSEAAKIQGFPENFRPHPVDRHANKQFGNAVSPPVVAALVNQVVRTGIFE